MSITAIEIKFLYQLARMSQAKNIIEFGCSFGISTIYLTAASKDNKGHVTTSEPEPYKITEAFKNIKKPS